MSPSDLHARRVAMAGVLSLAVAMGIGRFAFTPLLPMMLTERRIDLAGASWLASANYLGYLVGALACTFQPWLWQRLGWPPQLNGPRLVRAGLLATVGLTLGMALPWPALWPWLRFAAGVASAFVFVFVSAWCLGQLARLGQPDLGAAIYTGPGAGIVVSGLAASAMVAAHWPAAAGWAAFGGLAAVLTGWLWPVVSPSAPVPAAASNPPAPAPAHATTAAATFTAMPPPGASPTAAGVRPDRAQHPMAIATLALAYGLAGFGYIITATFLPVIARAALPGSPWLDLFWPVFGLGVIAGALLAARLRFAGDLRLALAVCFVVQALGIGVGLWWPTLAGFALGSLLLGLPFTAITFYAMQEARRLRPGGPTALIGGLTALYGLGQIVGPPLASLLVARSASVATGFDHALGVACGALMLGAGLFAALAAATRRG